MDQRTRAVGAKHASAEAWVRVLLSQDHACVGIARGEDDLVSYSNKKTTNSTSATGWSFS